MLGLKEYKIGENHMVRFPLSLEILRDLEREHSNGLIPYDLAESRLLDYGYYTLSVGQTTDDIFRKLEKYGLGMIVGTDEKFVALKRLEDIEKEN